MRLPNRNVGHSPVFPGKETVRPLTQSTALGPCTVKTKGPPDNLQRRDASAARMTAFRGAIGRAKKEWFDDKYGEKQLYLSMLACHPDYQKRGAGEMLCRWGVEKGKAEGLTVTLFASPMGWQLYRRIGFKDVGTFRTQVVGEDEYLDTPGMALERHCQKPAEQAL